MSDTPVSRSQTGDGARGFHWQRPVSSPADPVVTRAGRGMSEKVSAGDPITAEIIRHGLISAAGQMKSAIIRTAFSQLIHETLDFAVALYDRQVRLLAQAPTLPLFSGTFSFAIDAMLELMGGEQTLRPGDIVVLNWPYATGAHGQ